MNLLIAIAVIIIGWVLPGLWLNWHRVHAPEGWEDGTGFHYGRQKRGGRE